MGKFKVGDRVRHEAAGVVLDATLKRLIPEHELFHGEWDAICDDGDDAIFREDQIELIQAAEPITAPETITLRDQFAMAALTGIARDSAYTLEGAERAARLAYQFADSMLAERERSPK